MKSPELNPNAHAAACSSACKFSVWRADLRRTLAKIRARSQQISTPIFALSAQLPKVAATCTSPAHFSSTTACSLTSNVSQTILSSLIRCMLTCTSPAHFSSTTAGTSVPRNSCADHAEKIKTRELHIRANCYSKYCCSQ